jgi:hypothetical protein
MKEEVLVLGISTLPRRMKSKKKKKGGNIVQSIGVGEEWNT